MFDRAVYVRIRELEQLVQPMNRFDVRIPAQFAKDSRAFDRFISKTVEFAEKSGAFDLSHKLGRLCAECDKLPLSEQAKVWPRKRNTRSGELAFAALLSYSASSVGPPHELLDSTTIQPPPPAPLPPQGEGEPLSPQKYFS